MSGHKTKTWCRLSFTLVERVPRKAHDFLLDASSNPANFPVQAGSLTCAPHPARGGECEVTKPRDGKLAWHGGLWPVPKALPGNGERDHRTPKPGERGTPSQSERRGKSAGCRKTNVRKHRKVCPGGDSWQSRVDSRGEPLFDGRSLPAMGKKLGRRTHGLDGVKGGDTHGRNRGAKSGESLSGSVHKTDKEWYKPRGEIHANARQEVGDGHSSDDGGDNITPSERRAISLDMPLTAGRGGANAQKATSASLKRPRVPQDRLCESAKPQSGKRSGNPMRGTAPLERGCANAGA